VTTPPRALAGCAVLAVGLWFLTSAASAGVPELPTESYKKAAEAELAFLKTRTAELAAKAAMGEKPVDGQIKPAIGSAMMLSVYAEVLGDAALKADAVKLAETLLKKDANTKMPNFKAAAEQSKKLTLKPGAGKPGGPMPKLDKYELTEIMSPFRGKTVGGLNIDRDIKDMTKKEMPTKIDPAAVEILAVRSAVISEFAIHYPNDKAKVKPDNLKKWDKYSKESVDFSKQLAVEAAKGKAADEKKLKTLLSSLLGRCTACHNDFRDDE
jgi:hypothetical protein